MPQLPGLYEVSSYITAVASLRCGSCLLAALLRPVCKHGGMHVQHPCMCDTYASVQLGHPTCYGCVKGAVYRMRSFCGT